jgi:hypothetical protein
VAGTCQQKKCTGALNFQKIASYPPTKPAHPSDTYYGWYWAADVNRDGLLDLIEQADTTQAGAATVWLGVGNGTFETSTVFRLDLPSFSGDEISLDANEDFNEDGLADVVVPDAEFSHLLVRLGRPGGGWDAPVDKVAGDPYIRLMATGDLNGDGHLDLVAQRDNPLQKSDDHCETIELLGRGDGTFASPHKLAAACYVGLRLLDWNGDGILDLLLGPDALHIMYGKGDGTFSEMQGCPVAGGVYLDLNQDGLLDVLWCPDRKRFAAALGQGGCNFTRRTDYLFSLEVVGFVVADLDGDGMIDVLVGGIDGKSGPILAPIGLFAGRADGTFERQSDLPIPWPGTQAPWLQFDPRVSDVNGDGRVDIVTASNTGIQVYANTCVQ